MDQYIVYYKLTKKNKRKIKTMIQNLVLSISKENTRHESHRKVPKLPCFRNPIY